MNNSNRAYNNADGNSKFHIAKLNPLKLAFLKQPIIVEDEIKVRVVTANKQKVKSRNFIIPIFYFLVLFLRFGFYNTSTVSFFFEELLKVSEEETTINDI